MPKREPQVYIKKTRRGEPRTDKEQRGARRGTRQIETKRGSLNRKRKGRKSAWRREDDGMLGGWPAMLRLRQQSNRPSTP